MDIEFVAIRKYPKINVKMKNTFSQDPCITIPNKELIPSNSSTLSIGKPKNLLLTPPPEAQVFQPSLQYFTPQNVGDSVVLNT